MQASLCRSPETGNSSSELKARELLQNVALARFSCLISRRRLVSAVLFNSQDARAVLTVRGGAVAATGEAGS